MQFKQNAMVLNPEGERIGIIKRVVLDPGTKEITHLVVEEGLFFTEKKLVPISMVEYSNPQSVLLKATEEELGDFPPFEETSYVPLKGRDIPSDYQYSDMPLPLYWYPPGGSIWWGHGIPVYPRPNYVKREDLLIPEGTVALQEGSEVFSKDDEHVGDVESVFVDPDEYRATHILISQGILFKDRKLIPTHWISTVMEDRIFLKVDSSVLENLPEYQHSA